MSTPEIDQMNDTQREIDMRRRMTAWQNQTINEIARERDEALKDTIFWRSMAEGRGRTDDEPNTLAERDEARERIKNNPWCEACLETDCCVSGDGTCAMIRKYLSEKSAEVKLAAVTEQRDEARAQRDELAEALKQCREDSVELLGERNWYKNEPRCGYRKQYNVTRDNVDRADAALQSLTPIA